MELNDKAGLDEVFESILVQPQGMDRGHYYQAMVDYADGLAWLNDDQRAWDYFEGAIDFHPEQNIEAINRYSRHLLDRGQAQQALDILETRLTSQVRAIYILPAHFRKEAMEILGLDTTSANEEIAVMRRRVIESGYSTAVRFITSDARIDNGDNSGLAELLELLFTPVAQALSPPWKHSDQSDDCRVKDWHAYVNFCDSFGNCFTPMAVNLAELIDNEAKTENIGARYTMGWTAKNRAFEALIPSSCGAYNGAYGSLQQTGACLSFPCGDPAYCAESQRVCCTVHGGATIVNGTPQTQTEWEDTHVSFSTLLYRGTIYAAWYVLDGYVPDPSTGWIPPGVSGCSGLTSCGAVDINSQGNGTLQGTSAGPFCSTGSNFFTPDPNGPMEYLNHPYEAIKQECKWRAGAVCANGTVPAAGIGDNYFWNRRGPSTAAAFGNFERIDGGWIASGWALDPDTPLANIDVAIWMDLDVPGGGTFLGNVSANQPRADVNQSTGYMGNHGWSFVIPAQYRGAPHTYYPAAMDRTDLSGTGNQWLSNTPRRGPVAAVPIGYFDGVTGSWLAYGWALDPDVPLASLDIHIWMDLEVPGGATFLGSVSANQQRPDVNQVTGYGGNHGWSFVIPVQYRGAPHTYYAVALDWTDPYSGASNVFLTLSPRRGPTVAVPIGSFEQINGSYVASGWTLDPDIPLASLDVHIWMDLDISGGAVFLDSVTANQSRPDINQSTGYGGNHGWSFVIPAQYRTTVHSYYAVALDWTDPYSGASNVFLAGTPRRK